MMEFEAKNRPEAIELLKHPILLDTYLQYRKLAETEENVVYDFDDAQEYMYDTNQYNFCMYCGNEYLEMYNEDRNNHVCSALEMIWDFGIERTEPRHNHSC